jgi:LysR family transcriptional regulator, regulator of peptidoglycan recycling
MFLTRSPPDDSEAWCFARSEYADNSLSDNRAAQKWCFHAGLTIKIQPGRPYLSGSARPIDVRGAEVLGTGMRFLESPMRGNHFAELNAFVAVAEQASFTNAARRLGLSTATLSQTVRALETRLGVRLLNRTTRSVAPTDAGERLLHQLRPLLDGFEAAIESVNDFREKPAGHLRLTMPPPVAKFVLAPVLARFLQLYPEIVIETTVESGFTDIVAGRYDAGFRRGNLVARDMIATRVTNDMHYLVVASPDYLARRGRPQTPADLHAHNCIRYRLPGGGFIPWIFAAGDKTVEFDVAGSVVVVNDPELVISAALEGVGIAYLYEDYVADLVAEGRLVSLLDKSTLPVTDGFFLFYPSRRQNPAALRALIDFLRLDRARKSTGEARAAS